MKPSSRRLRHGFTLVELSIVVVIIGILMAFVLAATYEATARAEQRATQALISKLEVALAERIDALSGRQATVTGAHRYLAAVFPANYPVSGPLLWGIPSEQRAQVIATFDMMKAEMPDVFYIQDTSGGSNTYPLNFAGVPYPNSTVSSPDYTLPIGNASRLYAYLQSDASGNPFNGPGGGGLYPTTGIFGASFVAAGGIYKQLGYLEAGYDGVDNNADGFIDDFLEGTGGDSTLAAKILGQLSNHDHKTARSEMLYALLVEGLGPLGSNFNADDFTEREVRDTDGDGLLEFVDAWGEPLQFFRWPIHYSSGIQLGLNPYPQTNPFFPREQDPLDPNQTLVSPAWWAAAYNGTTVSPPTSDGQESGSAFLFENFFHRLVDWTAGQPLSGTNTWWDRGHRLPRRAYFSKFLISSGGPDKEQGIARLNVDYGTGSAAVPVAGHPGGSYGNFGNSANLILIENTAARISPIRDGSTPYLLPASGSGAITGLLEGWSADDITNQIIQTAGGGVQ